MKIEERRTWMNGFDTFTDADIISFGSESCVVPVLDIYNHWDLFLKILKLDIRIKIVTPRVSQSEIADVINLLNKIVTLRRKIDLVVNDWGLFYYSYHNKNCFNIHIGRQLCRSLIDCPWHQEIMDNEVPSTQRIIKTYPFNGNNAADAGIFGVELNKVSNDIIFDHFDEKIEIAIHEDDYILTCGRTCLIKKIYPRKSCYDICDHKVHIDPVGKWLNYFDRNVPMTNYEKALLSNIALNGKKIVKPQENFNTIFSKNSKNIVLIKYQKEKRK